ncbi:MAG TPA: succinate dehydrogenase assembly factor 2 [Caulobacteraceae bacterium]|jgi:antitoxin CptB
MDEHRRKRARLRAWRRGFREADLILGPFADAHLESMPSGELEAFERLLDVPDQDLYAWIIGQAAAPAAFEGPVLSALRASIGAPLPRGG